MACHSRVLTTEMNSIRYTSIARIVVWVSWHTVANAVSVKCVCGYSADKSIQWTHTHSTLVSILAMSAAEEASINTHSPKLPAKPSISRVNIQGDIPGATVWIRPLCEKKASSSCNVTWTPLIRLNSVIKGRPAGGWFSVRVTRCFSGAVDHGGSLSLSCSTTVGYSSSGRGREFKERWAFAFPTPPALARRASLQTGRARVRHSLTLRSISIWQL